MLAGLTALVALVVGLGAGLVLGRRAAARRGPAVANTVGPHLLPDPALDWFRRAYGALGVWVGQLDPDDEGPRTERMLHADHLSASQIASVDRRLERARDREQGGVERLDGGTFVFRAAGGFAVGILLRPEHDVGDLPHAEADLDRLLDGVRRRPQVVALVQAQAQDAQLESAGSVGLRLAYQLERALGAEVVVAAVDGGRVRVIGVSGRGDRRVLNAVLPNESDLARVATGALGRSFTPDDPLGGAVADRRQRNGAALLIPIMVSTTPVGAVAIWLPSGEEPAGPANAELAEAVANAGPRIARALEADRRKQAATVDPLTGLCNRRGLDEILGRHDVQKGALIYADLDRFKLLNDTLGHPAGDAALTHFARILREQIRSTDTAARIGGEEFAVWLPDATLDLGYRIAERIRIKLGTTSWDWRGRHWPLSASFGVAACPETSRRVENLSSQADSALYVAKKSGRNRVERAGSGERA